MAAIRQCSCLVIFALIYVTFQADVDRIKEECTLKVWCKDCITARKECAWCKDEDMEGPRCSSVSDLSARKCSDIYSPNTTYTAPGNRPLQDGGSGGSGAEDPVQVQPQHVKLKLRRGESHSIEMKYRVARNLPIDMYFVLDYSFTMRDRLLKLATLTDTLITGLKQTFTENIFIGFGSFIDKVILPFKITTPPLIKNPCLISNATCKPSYGYIHRKQLNSDINAFIASIKNENNTSSNFDDMEGGLDAVLQAAVCPDVIGWRSRSRRVMVYYSDSGFHFAGDAKLAGIDKPNDGQCHMITTGAPGEYIYSESITQDYPSFGQLAEVLDQNKINTFFMVDPKVKSMYEDMSKMIKQAKTQSLDTSGADSLVSSITDFYTELSSKVSISAEGIPDWMDVTMGSHCASGSVVNTVNLRDEPKICKLNNIYDLVTFNITMVAHECPRDGVKSSTIKILPQGLQELLVIDVEYLCDCTCATTKELDDQKCSGGNGTFECGVCRCNEGRGGEVCQCDNTARNDRTNTDVVPQDTCIKNGTMTVPCSNNGNCECGQCLCFKKYQGKYCECDTRKCVAPESSEMCSGSDRGTCVCDECKCNSKYTGQYCECESQEGCIGPNGVVCSGHGQCKCGRCVRCDEGYSGTTCEECAMCEKCRKCAYASCVKCLDRNLGSCEEDCNDINVTEVARFERGVEPCGLIDDNCEMSYIVICENKTVNLMIANKKQCQRPPDPLLIAMPILAGIIGVGLLLLIIWKILTSFYDTIEYARFEHEISNPKWSKTDNPIFVSPVTTNQNPTFTGKVD